MHSSRALGSEALFVSNYQFCFCGVVSLHNFVTSGKFFQQGNGFVLIVHMEVPFAARLKAYYWAVFTIICAVGPDDPNVVQPVVIRIFSQSFANLLAAPLFTFFAGADVEYFGGCMFFFAHAP